MSDYDIIDQLEKDVCFAIEQMFLGAIENTPNYINGVIINYAASRKLYNRISNLFHKASSKILQSAMEEVNIRDQNQLNFIAEIIPGIIKLDKRLKEKEQ